MNGAPKSRYHVLHQRNAGWSTGVAAQDDGWAFLGAVGTYLRQLDPAFDARSYGHKQLSPLIKSRPDLFRDQGIQGSQWGFAGIREGQVMSLYSDFCECLDVFRIHPKRGPNLPGS